MGFRDEFKKAYSDASSKAGGLPSEIPDADVPADVPVLPVVGTDGVRYLGKEGFVVPYRLTVHKAHIERRKWSDPEGRPDVLRLSAVMGVDIKLRWRAVNSVTVSTAAGEKEYRFNDADDAKRFHAVLAEYLRSA